MKSDKQLFPNLVHIIEQGKKKVAFTVNSAVVHTYWQAGKAINEHILKNERAEYGKEIVSPLATQLSWSHFLVFLPLKSNGTHIFYAQNVIEGNWGKRELPAKEKLEQKLHTILLEARQRIEMGKLDA